ncbi:MAG: glycoside hydrolase family 3 N-terminal domain-containing protein [Leptolyngbyaceae cyanobacterium MO_188.B28]|nr:glycoside hydrolase family 3 N-terminal domain-containing protein [Leptolyngbyaceae cyanobacterium MO_188.B28]
MEQAAQMVVVRASGHLFDHQIQYPTWEADNQTLQVYLGDLGVGGVILLGGSAGEIGLRSQQLQGWAKTPLLLAADIEEGVGQRFSGATWFPPPMALGAIAAENPSLALSYAEQMGAITAQEAQAIGLNWVLAPVVDVNNNPANPVINIRAFGDKPDSVGKLAAAFIRGAQRHAVLTTAKHFPGHGDTAVDSHLTLPTLTHRLERLAQIEFPPFQHAIAAGVDAVMSAHLQVPALDFQHPATLSHPTLTRILRRQLGFQGLIVTDALVMGAITQQYGPYEAAVLAVEAGADILLMPPDPEGAIRAVCEAVRVGRIPPERLQASLERIWRAKYKVASPTSAGPPSLHAWEHPPAAAIQLDRIAQPQSLTLAANILKESTLSGGPLPLDADAPTGELRNLIVVDDSLNCRFLSAAAPAISLPQRLGYSLQLIDSCTPCPAASQPPAQPTLLQLFIRGNPFRGGSGLTEAATQTLHTLIADDKLQALIIYGSPYILQQLQPQIPDTLPYCFTYGQTPEAQAISLEVLFGRAMKEMGISGGRRFTD